jgi:hypothetical protein
MKRLSAARETLQRCMPRPPRGEAAPVSTVLHRNGSPVAIHVVFRGGVRSSSWNPFGGATCANTSTTTGTGTGSYTNYSVYFNGRPVTDG